MKDYIIHKKVDCDAYISVRGMSKVINRKKYDTDTADILIHKYIHNRGYNGEKYEHKSYVLFQKSNGEFFSIVVEYSDQSIDWHYAVESKVLTPLSEEEAKDFAEKYGTGSEYEDIFGEVEE